MTADQDTWEALNQAAICGLMFRFGPTEAQLTEFPWWRRAASRILPRSHRWRVHPLAPRIREFNRLVGPPPE